MKPSLRGAFLPLPRAQTVQTNGMAGTLGALAANT